MEGTFIVSRNHTTELNTASSNEDKEVGIIKWEVRIDGILFSPQYTFQGAQIIPLNSKIYGNL